MSFSSIAWLALTALLLSAESSFSAAGETVTIWGFASKCLTAPGGVGVKVVLSRCINGLTGQQWEVRGKAFVNDGSCLDVEGGSTQQGARVVVSTCQQQRGSQEWRVSGRAIVGWQERCLDVEGARPDDGTPVIMWRCHGESNQWWQLAYGK
ncbi:MAG TPA: ricin-type beta-trefoil lectin domain protein [Rhizomicrobium sp.]|jgi:hypothetical protein